MHRAIETRYRGYRFRSRLEARWAVFFDALGLKWEYEPEGFELPGGGRYLPDFLLHAVKGMPPVYVEIKAPKPMTAHESEKLQAFGESVANGALMPLCEGFICFVGDPVNANGFLWGVFAGKPKAGLLDFDVFVGMFVALSKRPDTAVKEAAFAARGARFEFGECGA